MWTDTTSPLQTAKMDNRFGALAVTLCALALSALFTLIFGLRETSLSDLWSSFTAFDATSHTHVVIQEIRLPRLVGATLAGAALGIAGALMQGMTRNPLADPGLLGINAGASIGVVICIMVLGITDPAGFIWVALAGAVVAAILVFFLGGGSQGSPARLILAGAAVSALFLALSRGLLLISQQTLDVYRFWVLGGFDGIQFDTIWVLLPFFASGTILAIIATLSLNALMLGDDVAKGLGVRIGLAQVTIGFSIVVLCGATVAMAGPIAFVGLIVPHLARWAAGADMRWMVGFSACFGACLLIAADLLGRLPLFGGNMQAGVMAALIGGPVLIWLVRQHGVRKL
ncbi:MAG: iron ABC transporter permease [Pseudomonadota bacterium]